MKELKNFMFTVMDLGLCLDVVIPCFAWFIYVDMLVFDLHELTVKRFWTTKILKLLVYGNI